MKNNERKEQSLSFQEQWKLYTTLYWDRIYSSIEDLILSRLIFPKESILLWGWIPYTLYKSSSFYNSNHIEVNNQDLNVYYYVREIKSIRNNVSNLKFFAFVNVMGVKDLVQRSNDEDHIFLKFLYDTKLGIHSIFDHEYKDHCWDSLTKEIIE